MRKARAICLALCLIILASSHASAKKVLFYEISVPQQYTKDGGYSKLRDKLASSGHDIAAISQGKLSRETIRTYDVLIMHTSKTLSTEEIATIVWFVSSEGGGILITGGSPQVANRLMPIFGMTLDEGTLIDATNSIGQAGGGRKQNSHFVVKRLTTDNITRFIRSGVTNIGFYEGHGLILSSEAVWIAKGDSDTYSDTLSFPSGSEPPVVAASIFGNGLAVGLGDPDIISDNYIDSYDNMILAANIISWLTTARTPKTSNISEVETEVIINTCNLERTRLETDKDNLLTEVEGLQGSVIRLTDELDACTFELDDLKHGKIGLFTRNQLAIILAGLMVLTAGIMFSRKRKSGKKETIKEGEDILSELGYEFEGEEAAHEGEESSTEEDITDEFEDM